MPRSLEAWRNMEHLPHVQKLHLSIHNYADSGVIHNLSLSRFSRVSAYMQESILTECEVSHSKYHHFWTTAQFLWNKMQNVALIAGFNLHSISSINSQKRKFMAILVEHTCSKKSNIWKYHETNISCAHILELQVHIIHMEDTKCGSRLCVEV